MSGKNLPQLPKTAATDWRPIEVISTKDEKTALPQKKPWKPSTLQMPFLAAMVLSTTGLVVLVQCLLAVSKRQQGLIFAEDINSLPLSRTFAYLYLPTIISVIYSFLWTWVDLDVKRLEPFFQLSRPGGAKASKSILLSYPLEFLVTIPLTAFKRRHWSVLTASAIMILVFWGLTPTQAGIFAVRTISISKDIAGYSSAGYIPIDQQGNLSSTYAQSVYNIAWLDETLPPFMTEDYVLSYFGPSSEDISDTDNMTFVGQTTLYSVDVACEEAISWNRSGIWYYNSSSGCSFNAPRYRPDGGTDLSKPFDTLYVGYQNEDGFADYYLSSDCDERYSHLFFLRWSESLPSYIKTANQISAFEPDQANATVLFCEATYYQQSVNATINLPSQSVVGVIPLGSKTSLPADFFNVSEFEWTMSSGQEKISDRGEYPTVVFPDQTSQLLAMPLNLAYVPKMAPFAIATTQWDAATYLDPDKLRASYESAYRLLFACQVKDILQMKFTDLAKSEATISYTIEAVVVVLEFAYAVTGLLVTIALLATVLLIVVCRRKGNLESDPSTIVNLMDLVAGDRHVAETLGNSDTASNVELEKLLEDTSLILHSSSNTLKPQIAIADDCSTLESNSDLECTKSADVEGVRPLEMRTWAGLVFLSVQLAAFVTFLVLYVVARYGYGLPLPSQSTITRQLVENFIPIALATFMEPFWLVLNRLLGLLQPFEELMRGDASSSRSIDVDYSSLPPQLLFIRALKARHFKLVALCLMVILANVLAVALGGIMYEGTVMVPKDMSIGVSKAAHFQNFNGAAPAFNSTGSTLEVGRSMSNFYREMSNLTAGTPLPPWTDDLYFYVPLDLSGLNTSSIVEVETTAIGAQTHCSHIGWNPLNSYAISFLDDASGMHINVTLAVGTNGSTINCTNFKPWKRSSSDSDYGIDYVGNPQSGRVAVEFNGMLRSETGSREDELYCRDTFLAGWMRADFAILEGEEAGMTIRGLPKMQVESRNETMLVCRSVIVGGPAKIAVDATGRVQSRISGLIGRGNIEQYFSTTPADLVAVTNQYIIDSDATWHKDSYPSDYLNYFMGQIMNDTTLLDASQPVPDSDDLELPLANVYRRLFAMLISTNIDIFLTNLTSPQTTTARVLTAETRILFSTPALVISEVILGCYIITTIIFYFRRPWRVLPRLPSTVASIIAFFAASKALQELHALQEDDDDRSIEIRKSWKWGYGSFTDSQGRQHVGIEREPYVTALRRGKSKTAKGMPDRTWWDRS